MNISDLLRQAQQGDPNAQLRLGMILVQEHNMHQGIHWILESVNQTGNMQGVFFLAVALNNVTLATEKK